MILEVALTDRNEEIETQPMPNSSMFNEGGNCSNQVYWQQELMK